MTPYKEFDKCDNFLDWSLVVMRLIANNGNEAKAGNERRTQPPAGV